MAVVADDFQRQDGSLGANWSGPYVTVMDGALNALTGSVAVASKGYAPVNSGAQQAYLLWSSGSFGNDQWAMATLKTVAPYTAVLSITAAAQSANNTTYTYTVSSGSVANAISGGALYVIISGMTNSGNNGHFTATTFGAGTFTVANASGVTESGSSGTGNCPSDSAVSVVVRGTTDGKNEYEYQVGTNSFSGDGRVAEHELWKLVSGSGTQLAATSAADTTPPVAGETLLLTVRGTTLSAFKNGVNLFRVTDSSLASGTPGLASWCMSGPQEYVWSNWPTVVNPPGNNGTTGYHWIGGDFAGSNPFVTDFTGTANTDLHSFNASFVENAGSFNLNASNQLKTNATSSGNALATYQGATFENDQWAQATSGNGGDVGVAVRGATSAYTGYFYRPGASNTRVLGRVVAGTITVLATSNTSHTNVAGDMYRLVVIGTTLYCYLNGVLENFGAITDSTISSGFPGIEGGSSTGGVLYMYMCGNAAISGNCGLAGATVTLSGSASASTTADSNGNYSFPSIADGTYTITPTKTNYLFSPASITETVVGGTWYPVGENFSSGPAGGGSGGLSGTAFGYDFNY